MKDSNRFDEIHGSFVYEQPQSCDSMRLEGTKNGWSFDLCSVSAPEPERENRKTVRMSRRWLLLQMSSLSDGFPGRSSRNCGDAGFILGQERQVKADQVDSLQRQFWSSGN